MRSHYNPEELAAALLLDYARAGGDVPLDVEGVVDSSVHRQKSPGRPLRLELLHVPLALANR